MSQNKTVVPGMEGAGYGRPDSGDFYARDTRPRGVPHGTVVPGMKPAAENEHPGGTRTSNPYPPQTEPGKPILGFLYSISRQGIGEYWPLYLGPNVIGCSPNCGICLREATVSSRHAVLMVRKLKNPDKTIASLEDTHSTNGTMLNGESLSFTQVECKNGDIITVGESYELVVFLIDVKALGLKVAENFIPIGEPDEPDFNPYYSPHTRADVDDIPYPPRFDNDNGGTNSNGGYPGNSGGTVGMDGGNIKSGGTVGM